MNDFSPSISIASLEAQQRVDLQSFKEKMRLLLKENAPSYWDCLRKFAQSKMTKKELEDSARNLLGSEENVALHNLFVRAIVHNAYCPYGPPLSATAQVERFWYEHPASTSTATTTTTTTTTTTSREVQKKEKKKKVQRGSKVLKSGAINDSAANGKEVKGEEVLNEGEVTTALQAQQHEGGGGEVMVPQYPLSCGKLSQPFNWETHEQILCSPHLLALRNRMHRVAVEGGLQHVDLHCVNYLSAAVQLYLAQILRNTPAVVKRSHSSLRTIHPPGLFPLQREGEGEEEQSASGVCVEDLLESVTTKPHLLGEDVAIGLERIAYSL